ncbi:hypothetical protein FOFC_02884 [Fusarium oxysporum]|nr:hypothetical protein FOFC_02884 [Fusarium oxysporum]
MISITKILLAVEELLTVQDTTIKTHLEAYRHRKLVYQDAHPGDCFSSPQLVIEEEFEEDPDDEGGVPE